MAKDFIRTWDDRQLEDWGSVVSKEFKQFQGAMKREVKRLAEEQGATLLDWHNGHYDMTGVLEKNGLYVYFQYSNIDRTKVVLTKKNSGWLGCTLMRTMKHAKDWTGGTNNNVEFEQFPETMARLFKEQERQTSDNYTNNSSTPKTNKTMKANELKAADLIGKTIVVGDNIATITIKSADGDTLQGEFHKEGGAPMGMPIKLENLRSMIEKGAWHLSAAEGADEANDSDPEPLTDNHKPEQDDPVMLQWKSAKAKNPDAVIIFRNGNVYVIIADDATKVSEVAGLKIAQHGDVPICVFPIGDLSGVMLKFVSAGIRVAIEDLIAEEATSNSQKGEDNAGEATEQPKPTQKARVQPRRAKPEANVNDNDDDITSEKEAAEEPAEEPTEEMFNGQSSMVNETKAERPQPRPSRSEVTLDAEKCSARIIDNGKSIIVAGDTKKIEAVLMTLWGRKRPYTHKGKTYSGIVLSAKHKATVQAVIKLAEAC